MYLVLQAMGRPHQPPAFVHTTLKRKPQNLGAQQPEPLTRTQLEPRERAEAHIALAQAVDVLQRMQWRAAGIDEDTRHWKETVRQVAEPDTFRNLNIRALPLSLGND